MSTSPSVSVSLVPLMSLSVFTCKTYDTVAIFCSCCFPILESRSFLKKIGLKRNHFIDYPVIGFTDTLFTKEAMHARTALNKIFKGFNAQHSFRRLVVPVFANCKTDLAGSVRGSMELEGRLNIIKDSLSQLKGLLPSSNAGIDIDAYLLEKAEKIQVSKIDFVTKAQDSNMLNLDESQFAAA